ncbi:MAG: helix-turn-helix transcriptional regulator [Promethearchaeota archaeon]
MWLGKFLNIEDDLNELKKKLKKEILKNLTKSKITPLEFTIIETIFNNKELSGYDLILNLNKHFAGTWTAQSGTIYPILSKLKKEGFLKSRPVKSPIGPIKTVYSLTEAGAQILKKKVNKNFEDQINFIENFIVELSSVYIQSFPKNERSLRIEEVHEILHQTFEKIKKNIFPTLKSKMLCIDCGAEITKETSYCPNCGTLIIQNQYNKE